jgi:hypothetical protein
MSESFEQQISHTVQADLQSYDKIVSDVYKIAGNSLRAIGDSARSGAVGAMLPYMHLFDSAHEAIVLGVNAGSEVHANHPSAAKGAVAWTEQDKQEAQAYKTDHKGNAVKLSGFPAGLLGGGPGTGTEHPLEPKTNTHAPSSHR